MWLCHVRSTIPGTRGDGFWAESHTIIIKVIIFFIVFNWSLMEGNDEYIKIFLFRHVHGEYCRETMVYSGFAGTYNLPKESRAARTPLG